MRSLKSFEVHGLFRHVNHKVEFNQDPRVTIIAGPNGAGKTHVLRLIRSMLAFDLKQCIEMPFDTAFLVFTDGRGLRVTRIMEGDGSGRLTFEVLSKSGRVSHRMSVDEDMLGDVDDDGLPPYIVQTMDGGYWDIRQDRRLTKGYVYNRYMGPARRHRESILSEHKALTSLVQGMDPILIDTKRLDVAFLAGPQEPGTRARPAGPLSPVKQYIEQVRAQVAHARSESLTQSQQADRNFAARALDPELKPVPESILRSQYGALSDLHGELYRNGLAASTIDVKLPDKKSMSSAERRILAVFLDDWEKKLRPLLPVNTKLNSLRRILNQKFIGKELVLDRSGHLAFEASGHENIPVETLSSGEQHILALFTMLLFSASSGSVVLIDEPEISLHAAWKHAFLDDIEEVSRLNDVTIVLATHSSAIVNGRWDLVQELGVDA